jgi:hypothetical protein
MTRFTKQVSLHGQRAYITTSDQMVAKGGFVAGGERSIGRQGGSIELPGNPARVVVFDDFLGDLVGDEWNYAETDTGANASGTVVAGTNGIFRIAAAATVVKTAAGNNAQINGGLPQWKPDQGRMRVGARLRISALTGANVFVGFADTGAALMPVYDTGGGIISTVSNAVGWLYSGGAASPSTVWRGVKVNADSVGSSTVTGDAPTANLYDVLEVELGDTGSKPGGDIAYFYQNGVLKGSLANPVLQTRAHTPTVAEFVSETTAFNVDVDWINVGADRDTGA